MENTDTISQDDSYNHKNFTFSYIYYTHDDGHFDNFEKMVLIMSVGTYVIPAIGLPLTLVAIYSLRSMVKDGNVAPIYVINLLITDILQFCCMIGKEAAFRAEYGITGVIFFVVYLYCLFVSVGFMVCVSLERYLVVAWPLWYRFRRTVKISVVVCVLLWILPVLLFLIMYFGDMLLPFNVTLGSFFLAPLPLFIFFLAGTLRALSASRSIPPDEKRRIVGVLVLVLLIYLLLFVPFVISLLKDKFDPALTTVILMVVMLSPLADLVLYVFMKRGAVDKLLSLLCCCRMDGDEPRPRDSNSDDMKTVRYTQQMHNSYTTNIHNISPAAEMTA